MKKILNKFHQGARAIIILMIFADIALRLEKVGLALKVVIPYKRRKKEFECKNNLINAEARVCFLIG